MFLHHFLFLALNFTIIESSIKKNNFLCESFYRTLKKFQIQKTSFEEFLAQIVSFVVILFNPSYFGQEGSAPNKTMLNNKRRNERKP